MINKTLLSISNRDRFFDPDLIADPAFQPSAQSEAVKQLREVLKLDDNMSDYHLWAILLAVEAYPAIARAFSDPVKSYDIFRYSKPGVKVYGASLVNDTGGLPHVKLVCSQWPVPDRLVVTYKDEGSVLVAYGNQINTCAFREADGVLYVAWPAGLGISGGLQLNGTWTAGSSVEIHARPVRFPYEQLVAAVEHWQRTFDVVEQAGLLNNFYLAENAVEKTAALALALGISNTSVYAN